MARISGIDLPRGKQVEIALTHIYGIGRSLSKEILAQCDIHPATKVDNLTDDEAGRIRSIIGDYKVEGELRTEVSMNIKRLMDIGCYRGLRHRRNLPVHGQRTRTNGRTRRGKRKTVAGRTGRK